MRWNMRKKGKKRRRWKRKSNKISKKCKARNKNMNRMRNKISTPINWPTDFYYYYRFYTHSPPFYITGPSFLQVFYYDHIFILFSNELSRKVQGQDLSRRTKRSQVHPLPPQKPITASIDPPLSPQQYPLHHSDYRKC